ncbi:CDCA2 protein, partial [Ptilonorhynchus violaceus]|nr:CDCA2 protein [Ptilonorhynchus violaceus]
GGTGSEALSDLSTKKGGFVEDLSLGMFDGSKAPVTPPRTGNIPIHELTQSGSLLRSILKKTPMKQPMDIPEVGSEYPNDAVGRGGGESAAVSNCVKAFETFQTDTSESHNSKTPKKKKVTFGEVLSPEIFDETLPANTPLRRGASPACPQLLQSPWARPGLPEEPLPRLDFGGEDECVEPLQEVLEGSVAAEAPSPVENTEVAETDKPDMVTTRSSTKRKSTAVSEESDCSTSGAPNTKSDQDTKNPRKNKTQRQKNPTSSAPR